MKKYLDEVITAQDANRLTNKTITRKKAHKCLFRIYKMIQKSAKKGLTSCRYYFWTYNSNVHDEIIRELEGLGFYVWYSYLDNCVCIEWK